MEQLELLSKIHRAGVWHGDIHPSNIGLLPLAGPLQLTPVFVDFERAVFDGRKPPGYPIPAQHPFSATRILSSRQRR